MKLFAMVLLLATTVICHAAPQVFGDQFAGRSLEAYIEKPAVAAGYASFEAGPEGHGAAIKTLKVLTFKEVAVDANTRYRLSFHASTQSSETIEENPKLRDIAFAARSFMPVSEIRFSGKDGKPIARGNQQFKLPYAQWQAYQWEFYPPADAVSMQWSINPSDKENTVTVADAKLTAVKDFETVNINPSFDMGPFNISGWTTGMLLETSDNHVLFKADYYSTSFTFPLTEPGTYELSLNASSFGRYNALFLIFLDANGKEISRFGERPTRTRKEWIANTPEPKQHTFYLTLPPGVSRGYFLVYQSLIYEIALKRVGDEASFATFLKKK